MYSNSTSWSVAPIVFIFTNPWMPNVDGKMYEKSFQYQGTDEAGHDMPEANNRIRDKKMKMTKEDSLSLTKAESVIEKKMQESRNGNMNNATVMRSPICGNVNRRGTTHNRYIDTMA